jgi:hypothetical protein
MGSELRKLALLGAALALSAASWAATPDYTVSIESDAEVYADGATASFTVTVTHKAGKTVNMRNKALVATFPDGANSVALTQVGPQRWVLEQVVCGLGEKTLEVSLYWVNPGKHPRPNPGKHKDDVLLASAALAVTVVDVTPPVIANLMPEDGSTLDDRQPVFSATFSDEGSGVDAASAVVTFDNENVTAQAAITAGGFSFTPDEELEDGFYTITVVVADLAGNVTSASWVVEISSEEDLVYGDSNLDGVFDYQDLETLMMWVFGQVPFPPEGSLEFIVSDVNADGVLDSIDMDLYVLKLMGLIDVFPVEE